MSRRFAISARTDARLHGGFRKLDYDHLRTVHSNLEENMALENFSGVSQDDRDFQRAQALHSWKLDMLVVGKHMEAAAQHLESARAAVDASTQYAAAASVILSCGAAIAAAYSICIDKAREGTLALTFLDYGLGWGNEKRMAVEQLLKTSIGTVPSNPAEMIDVADATLQETRHWFQTNAVEANEN